MYEREMGGEKREHVFGEPTLSPALIQKITLSRWRKVDLHRN
jgi:hypothetical protein